VRLTYFKFCFSLTKEKNDCLGVSVFAFESKGKLFSQPGQAKGFRIIAVPSYSWATGEVAYPKATGIS